MARPPGTDDSAFLTFALVDELIRTLTVTGLLTNDDIAEMLDRVLIGMAGERRPQAERCVPIVKEMLKEYRS